MPNDTTDQFQLNRFLEAQDPVYAQALGELRAGEKRTHWMWFIFPQFAGLGTSAMAQRYAIQSKAEAEAYLQHPVLAARLHECARALLAVEGRSATAIMGSPDDVKLFSSMTLFREVTPPGSVFEQVLQKYYSGRKDEKTLELLNGSR